MGTEKRCQAIHQEAYALQNQSIKLDQCHTEGAKSYLSGLEENGRRPAKANGDLNKDKLPQPSCGGMGEKSNSSFSAETLVYT